MGTTAALAAFTIVPRHVLGGSNYKTPSETLNIAGVGIGGMGKNNVKACKDENIVALCDVDAKYSSKVFDTYPNAKIHTDYRKMLDKQKDIDAVIVATPDHTHAVIAMAAMRLGKHVYVQKPMTRTVYEARMLTEAAVNISKPTLTNIDRQATTGTGPGLIQSSLPSACLASLVSTRWILDNAHKNRLSYRKAAPSLN